MLKRISCIQSLVNNEHLVIVDLCCDHGKIGCMLARYGRRVDLVDRVPAIIQHLRESKLPVGVTAICADATSMQFSSNSQTTYIIAGVGGHLGVKILNNLLPQIKLNDEIILCIHSHQEVVWEYLGGFDLELLDEKFLVERGKYYQLHKLKKCSSGQPKLGEILWADICEDKKVFLQQRRDYYQKKSHFGEDPSNWLKYYQELLKSS